LDCPIKREIIGKKVIKRKGVEIEVMTKSRRVDQKNSPEDVLKLNKNFIQFQNLFKSKIDWTPGYFLNF
jgi:hypothetical protein